MEYSELKTTDISSVQHFIQEHAEQLETHQIHLRKKDGLFWAELFMGTEPAT